MFSLLAPAVFWYETGLGGEIFTDSSANMEPGFTEDGLEATPVRGFCNFVAVDCFTLLGIAEAARWVKVERDFAGDISSGLISFKSVVRLS